MKKMYVLGLDIGTTSISLVALDGDTGRIALNRTLHNDAQMIGTDSWAAVQDPIRIRALAEAAVAEACSELGSVSAIGVTGQMHGIVYLDGMGRAVSPLYTWQDGRGDLLMPAGKSYVEHLQILTGYRMASGFGLATHFVDILRKEVPRDADMIVTIADYVAMGLSGVSRPLLHSSMAASLGLYDLAAEDFDTEAFERAGISRAQLPPVTGDCRILGTTEQGVPVAVAIGDNQASFLGSVRLSDKGVLINIGTGSQISVYMDEPADSVECEIRPLGEGRHLMVGSSLCGGYAYAILRRFFQQVIDAFGSDAKVDYAAMDALAVSVAKEDRSVAFATQFSGTRANPSLRGAITGLSEENFTPAQLTLSLMRGEVEELHAYYAQIAPLLDVPPRALVGSGNGIRKNPIIQRLAGEMFDIPFFIPDHVEEAAFGAALFSLVAAGKYSDLSAVGELVRYRS